MEEAGKPLHKEMVPAWNLTLELVAANNRRRGWLTMYRIYSGGDLQLDMNLLTSLLPATLADALDRVLGQQIAIGIPDDDLTQDAAIRAS